MLNLTIDRQPLELQRDFSMTMNLKSPVFNDIGSNSYPFRIPASPRNKKIIDFIHRIEGTGNPYREFNCEFSFNGFPLFAGIGKFKIFNPKTFEGNILEGNGAWNYQMKNNWLQNYDFGSLTFDTEQDAVDWINSIKEAVYPDQPCAFPQILNTLYFGEEPVDAGLHSFNKYFSADDNIHILTSSSNRTIIVPMLYLRYVLDKLFTGMGFSFSDSFFTTHEDFNKLVLYNSVTCNNDPDSGFFQYYLTNLLFNYHVPYIKVSDFITGLETMFNIRFFVNHSTHTVKVLSLQNVLTDPTYVDYSENVLSLSTELEEFTGGYKLSQELDSDDTAFEDQIALEEEFLKYVKGSVEKLTDLPAWPSAEEMEIRYVYETDTFYRMYSKTWTTFPTWLYPLLTKHLFKDATGAIETKFSTLMIVSGPGTAGLKCQNKQENWNQITPRLLYTQYGNYSDHYILGCRNIAGPGSLFMYYDDSGNYGLFNIHYRDWLKWRINTRLVKMVRLMSPVEIRDFDFSRKIMVNGVKYLVKSVQMNLKLNSIQPATFELYTC